MKNVLEVVFSNGQTFRIPAEIIAKDRAAYYARLDSEENPTLQGLYSKVYAEEFQYAMGERAELLNWVSNNMDWSDVEEFAVEVPTTREIDFEKEWPNAEKKYFTESVE